VVKFTELKDYIEYLASQHKDIRHSATEKHFYRFELDDVLTSMGDINYKALILEGYDFSFQDARSDNVVKDRNCAFIIIDYEGDSQNHDRISQIYDECEQIGDEIIIRILNDKKKPSVPAVRDFHIESTTGTMIANGAKGYYGIRYMFALKSPRTNDIDTSKWIDSGSQSE
jgi:hypothetical protein